MKAAALRGALSDRARNGRIHVVSGLLVGRRPVDQGGGRRRSPACRSASTSSSSLQRSDELTWKSLRNASRVHLLVPDQLNTYDVLVSDDVVFTRGALDEFLAGPAKGRSAKGAASESEAQNGDVA